MRAACLPLALLLALPLLGCEESAEGAADAATDTDAAQLSDAAEDAAPDAPLTASGLPCTFNRECPAAERCACDEDAGCSCELGPRGTGQVGVDTCDDGNDCASSLCAEGPAVDYFCSDECEDETDCAGALPLCADIDFIGRICIRSGGD